MRTFIDRHFVVGLVLLCVAIAISILLAWILATQLTPMFAAVVGTLVGVLSHAALAATIHEYITGSHGGVPVGVSKGLSRRVWSGAAVCSIVAADGAFYILNEHRLPIATIRYIEDLNAQGWTVVYLGGGNQESDHKTVAVVYKESGPSGRPEVRRLNWQGQTIGDLAGPVAELHAGFGVDFASDPSGDVVSVVAADVVKDDAHPGPELIVVRRHRGAPVSSLEIFSLEGERLQEPMLTVGALSSATFDADSGMIVVAGSLPVIGYFLPEMSDYPTVFRMSTLPVAKAPVVIFGILPGQAIGMLPPLPPVAGHPQAHPQWMYARLPDTQRETAGNGWTVRTKGLNLVTRSRERAADLVELVLTAIPHDTADSVAQGVDSVFRVDVFGKVDAPAIVAISSRPGAPRIGFVPVDLALLEQAVPRIEEQARAHANASEVIENLRAMRLFASAEMDHVARVVQLLWTRPVFVNNIAYRVATSEDPPRDLCLAYAHELTVLMTQPLPTRDRIGIMHTIGTLLFRAGNLSGAFQTLQQCPVDADNVDPAGTCVVLYLVTRNTAPERAQEARDRLMRLASQGLMPGDPYLRSFVPSILNNQLIDADEQRASGGVQIVPIGSPARN